MRLRLDIAYDGTDFHGWGRQPALRTVQGVLEENLATVFSRHGPPPTLVVAGRTDAGVHAIGQVAHLDLTPDQLDSLLRSRGRDFRPDAADAPAALARRLNGIAGLDADVWLTSAAVAPEGFDARFSAVWRRYAYRVADARAPRDPVDRRRTLWYPAELDAAAMDAVAAGLVGLHDWAAYCRPREGATTIRSLQDFRWTREPGGLLVAEVRADAFCHSMVRALVGASLAVGEGRLAPSRLVELRDRLQRSSEFKVAPAKGLTLVAVGYPADELLAAQSERARARRDGAEVTRR